jgi:hypothetical protein
LFSKKSQNHQFFKRTNCVNSDEFISPLADAQSLISSLKAFFSSLVGKIVSKISGLLKGLLKNDEI